MTYSIVARDPQTGRFGVAVQSHYLGVGPVVPWLEPGVGAVATQASVNLSFGPLGLDLLPVQGGCCAPAGPPRKSSRRWSPVTRGRSSGSWA